MTGHFPRHILLNRLNTVGISYRPVFAKEYGRKANQYTMVAVDSEEELFQLLLETSGKDVYVTVDYDLGDGEFNTGVHILRKVIEMAETNPNFIPPGEFYVQKHPVEMTDLVQGLLGRMAAIRERKLNPH